MLEAAGGGERVEQAGELGGGPVARGVEEEVFFAFCAGAAGVAGYGVGVGVGGEVVVYVEGCGSCCWGLRGGGGC